MYADTRHSKIRDTVRRKEQFDRWHSQTEGTIRHVAQLHTKYSKL